MFNCENTVNHTKAIIPMNWVEECESDLINSLPKLKIDNNNNLDNIDISIDEPKEDLPKKPVYYRSPKIDGIINFNVPKLSSESKMDWILHVRSTFCMTGLLNILDKKMIPKSDDSSYELWYSDNQIAKNLIAPSLNAHQLTILNNMHSVAEAVAYFTQDKHEDLVKVASKFYAMTQDRNRNCYSANYFESVKSIINEVLEIGGRKTANLKIILALVLLPRVCSEYSPNETDIHKPNFEKRMNQMEIFLNHHNEHRKSRLIQTITSELGSKRRNKNVICRECKRRGHKAKYCRYAKEAKK